MKKETGKEAPIIKELGNVGKTLSGVTKFTGTALLIICGALVTIKLGKIIIKDLKDLGL